jgi:thioredoxin 1
MNNVLQVVCLCAQWCAVCREYAAVFERSAQALGGVWQWLDVEDQADLLGAVEVENFPTLLISHGGRVLFFGVVQPNAHTLQRLVLAAQAGNELALPALPEIAALAQRLQGAP